MFALGAGWHHSEIPPAGLAEWAPPSSLSILGVPRTSRWALNSQLLGPPWLAIETSLALSPGGGLCQAQGTLGQRGWVTLHQSVMSTHQCCA